MSYPNLQNIDCPIYGKVYGSKILFRGRSIDGTFVDTIIDDFAPSYYINSRNDQPAPYGLYGEQLKKVTFDSLAESSKWLREMKDCDVNVHGVISPEVLLFAELPKKNPILPTDFRTLFYDIETTVTPGTSVQQLVEDCNEQITLISTYDNMSKKVHLFLYNDPNRDAVLEYEDEISKKYTVEYHLFQNEKEMLLGFLTYYQELNPHILSGWNTQGFDNVYVYKRLTKLFGEKTAARLSPFGVVKTRTIPVFGKDQLVVDFYGVADYDYLEIYKAYTYHSMSSYRLDAVAEYELGVSKLHHNGSFKDFYETEWDKFVAYNIRDTLLVVEIDLATDLMSVAVSVAQMCGVNLSDTFGTIKKLDALTMQYATKSNIVIPPIKREEGETFPGGYVAEPQVGRQYGVISVDAASLYPSMIRMFNISPETQVPYYQLSPELQKLCENMENEAVLRGEVATSALDGTPYCITGAGVVYDQTKQGIVPMIMTDLYAGRKADKKKSIVHKKNYLAAKEELARRGIAV
jgi:DNA polymerase elongation subunit (family B)